MKFTISLTIDNESLAVDAAPEIARILRQVATRVEHGTITAPCRDYDGNVVGQFMIEETEET